MQQHTHSNSSSHHCLMRVKSRPPIQSHATLPSAHPKQKEMRQKDTSNPTKTFLLYRTEAEVGLQADRRLFTGVGNVHCICTCIALHYTSLLHAWRNPAHALVVVGGGFGGGSLKDEDEGDWGAWHLHHLHD